MSRLQDVRNENVKKNEEYLAKLGFTNNSVSLIPAVKKTETFVSIFEKIAKFAQNCLFKNGQIEVAVNDKFPERRSQISTIVEQLLNPDIKGLTIVCHGPSGGGKTAICREIVCKLNYPYIVIPCFGYSTPQQLLKFIWSEAKMAVKRVYNQVANNKSKSKFTEIPGAADLFSSVGPAKFSKLESMLRQLMHVAFGGYSHEAELQRRQLALHTASAAAGDSENNSDEEEDEEEIDNVRVRSSPVYLLVVLDRLDAVQSLDSELFHSLLALSSGDGSTIRVIATVETLPSVSTGGVPVTCIPDSTRVEVAFPGYGSQELSRILAHMLRTTVRAAVENVYRHDARFAAGGETEKGAGAVSVEEHCHLCVELLSARATSATLFDFVVNHFRREVSSPALLRDLLLESMWAALFGCPVRECVVRAMLQLRSLGVSGVGVDYVGVNGVSRGSSSSFASPSKKSGARQVGPPRWLVADQWLQVLPLPATAQIEAAKTLVHSLLPGATVQAADGSSSSGRKDAKPLAFDEMSKRRRRQIHWRLQPNWVDGMPLRLKCLLVACFIASNNPADSDSQKLTDEQSGKRRRQVAGTEHTLVAADRNLHGSGAKPVPLITRQFSLERLVSIFMRVAEAALSRRGRTQVPSAYGDTSFYSSVCTLVSSGFLHPVSSWTLSHSLYCCSVSYDQASDVADSLSLKLDNYLVNDNGVSCPL